MFSLILIGQVRMEFSLVPHLKTVDSHVKSRQGGMVP